MSLICLFRSFVLINLDENEERVSRHRESESQSEASRRMSAIFPSDPSVHENDDWLDHRTSVRRCDPILVMRRTFRPSDLEPQLSSMLDELNIFTLKRKD
ncbi:hypothetical protein AMECASPLE_007083 [Ameca splendens]|uniref:Uncharacterized protein n=1 Tax=Ameca splendens TaxID=208324 RepID=A0ABV0XCN6_9TELE